MTCNVVGVADVIKACNRIGEHLTSAVSLYFGIVRHCEENTNTMSKIRWYLGTYVCWNMLFFQVCTYVCMLYVRQLAHIRLTRNEYPLPVGSRRDKLVA